MSTVKNLTGIDMAGQQQAITAVKRPVLVQVDFAARDGVLVTLEGPVSYNAGDALVTGLNGEDRWPVSRSVFQEFYTPVAPTKLAEPGVYKKKARKVLALQVHEPFCADLAGSRGRLTGKPGDWLVQYTPGEFGVVASSIFASTYEPVN